MPKFQPMFANSSLDTQATIFTGATFIWIFRYRQKLSLVCPACYQRQQNAARIGGSGRVSPLLELLAIGPSLIQSHHGNLVQERNKHAIGQSTRAEFGRFR